MEPWFSHLVPQRIIFDFGAVQIYWYGVIMVCAVCAGFLVVRSLYRRTTRDEGELIDVVFYAVLWGLVGARLWHVFVFQWVYYSQHPFEIVQIWQGGIAIQGAIIGSLIYLYVHVRRRNESLWQWTDLCAPGLALGQAIGRWGNFFNQELYGTPTRLPWALYIEPRNRVPGYESFSYFHPTFLYESALDFILFVVLWRLARSRSAPGFRTLAYLFGYGLIRFMVDFFRIDPMPMAGPLRLSQVISLVFMVVAAVWWVRLFKKHPAAVAKT